MFPASVQGPGVNLCVPDVCLTPVGPAMVPIPYVNIGLHALAQKYSMVVRFGMLPALNIGSMLSATQGDEPGVGGGVTSGTVMGPGYFRVGSPVVMVENLPAVRMTSTVTGNNNNIVGTVIAPGIPTVLIAFDREASSPADLTETRELAISMLASDLGLVSIDCFRHDVARVFFNAWRALQRQGAKAVVLDLRGCPGGDLQAAYELAADFLPRGALLGKTVDADGDAFEHTTHRDGPYRMPVMILMDGETKSAAEAFIGALGHHHRAITIGTSSFGKASIERCSDVGSAARTLSSGGHVLLPDGRDYAGVGIEPDLHTHR